jgi:hypothetical protein
MTLSANAKPFRRHLAPPERVELIGPEHHVGRRGTATRECWDRSVLVWLDPTPDEPDPAPQIIRAGTFRRLRQN